MLSRLFKDWYNHISQQSKLESTNGLSPHQQAVSDMLQKADELYKQGHTLQAEKLFQEILDNYPDEPNACQRLGRLKGQTGNYATARIYLEQAINVAPDFAYAWSDLGNICKLQGNLEEAHKCYQKAVSLEPDNLVARCNLGASYLDLGKKFEATTILEQVVKNNPEFVRGRHMYGQVLLKTGEYEKAVSQLEHVYLQDSSSDEVLIHLVSTLINIRNFDRALELSEKALQANPDSAEAHISMGVSLLKMDRLEGALEHLQCAVELNPDSYDAHNNIGITLQYLGRIGEAHMHYNKAIQLRSGMGSHDARLHRSIAYLMMGDYEKGWAEYDMRFEQKSRHVRAFPFAQYDGSSLDGRTLLVHAEQGIGDEIMFASCIPDLLRQEGKIILDCHPKLGSIFSRSFPDVVVHGSEQTEDTSWVSKYEPIDVQIPIGSLPGIFRKGLSQFPNHHGYLYNDAKDVGYWKDRLKNIGSGINVGISWQGGTDKTNSTRRVIELEKWLHILQQPGFNFISLQYTDCRGDIEKFRQDHGIEIHHWQEAIDDYEQTAALIEALDLVISVQTAIVHLAGALGQTVWVLVPAIPEWRYGFEGNTMPWYPSARLFRQTKLGEWDNVIEDVLNKLCQFKDKPET